MVASKCLTQVKTNRHRIRQT